MAGKKATGKQIVKYEDKYVPSGTGGIQEIKHLEKLVNLKILHLEGNGITEIKGLPPNLEELSLRDNPIGILKKINHLHSLTKFDIGHTPITSIYGAFEGMNELEIVNMSFCPNLQSTEGIQGAPNIKHFNLEGNVSLKSLKGIDELKNLDTFSVAGCGLKSIEELENLLNLKILDLSGNKLTNLKSLKNLRQISVIQVDREILDDPASVRYLRSLPALKNVVSQIEGKQVLFNHSQLKKLCN